MSKFLIIILPISYNNNILYFLSTHKSNFANLSEKKREKFYFQLIKKNVCHQIFHNKYQKKKQCKTKDMFLYLWACIADANIKIWFINGTSCFMFLQDIDKLFSIFYIKKIWDMHAQLKEANVQEYKKLIIWYKAALN